jgi:hypothetical protein
MQACRTREESQVNIPVGQPANAGELRGNLCQRTKTGDEGYRDEQQPVVSEIPTMDYGAFWNW